MGGGEGPSNRSAPSLHQGPWDEWDIFPSHPQLLQSIQHKDSNSVLQSRFYHKNVEQLLFSSPGHISWGSKLVCRVHHCLEPPCCEEATAHGEIIRRLPVIPDQQPATPVKVFQPSLADLKHRRTEDTLPTACPVWTHKICDNNEVSVTAHHLFIKWSKKKWLSECSALN